ncbi:MAG: tetratricopeptide repeat protein [Chitinispirillales bacterium]|jgi:tetratricopeptide (TPR) repeat protein|nr:tetratricopeptide repeat protein [Chitinispirillales bacterium]
MAYRVKRQWQCVAALALFVLSLAFGAFGDEAMEKLISEGKFDAAVKHGEAIAADDRTADVWVMLGVAYDNAKGDADGRGKAKSCFENAMKANPSHPGLYLAYGNYEFKGGNFPAAIGHYQKSFLLERSAAAAEGIAKAAIRVNDKERARDAAESAIDINPDALESRVILSDILYDVKSYASAAPHLEYVASKKGKDIDIWRKLVVCYENTKDADKLAAADAQIIALDPKDVKSRQRHADYAMAKGDTQTALKLYKELALLTPNDAKPFKNLYEASLKEGNKKDGITYLKNYVLLDSSSAAAIAQLADLLYDSKDTESALIEYRKAIRRDANIKGIYKNYTTILIDKKIDEEIIKAVQKAITLKEADAVMYAAAGDIYKKRNDNQNAIKMYQAALGIDKQNMGLLVKLAEAQAASGDTRNAIVSYEQIVVLNQNASAEYKVLGDLVTKSGKVKEGIENYKKYLAKVPADQEVAVKVGLYEYGNKQYKDAISYLSKVTDTKQITTDVLFALGDSYNRNGDCKQAVSYFEKVRAANPPAAVLANTLRPLAACYEKAGDKVKAADAYSAYTQLPNVKDADASYFGAYLREETDMNAAVRRYEANAKAYPRDARNFTRLGLHYAKSDGTLFLAVNNLRTASLLSDTSAVVWKTLGDVYGKQKNTAGELSAYMKYLSLKQENVAVSKRVGTIQIERKQYAAGVANLEKAAAAKPDDYEVCMMLATGYLNTNKQQEAASQFKKAKSLKPDDVSIRLSLIEALEKSGDADGAKEEKKSLADLDRKIVAADKKNIESRQRIVTYCKANNDNARAYIYLNELAELTPKDPAVFKSLYDIAVADGKKKEAVVHLKKYIALKPGTAEAQKSLGLLLYDEKDYDGALNAFREARKADPAVKGIYKEYMTALTQKKLDSELLTAGTAAIAVKELDAAGYKAMGDIYTKQGKHADAAKMYKGALDIDKQNTALLSTYAESQAKAGDLKGASITYEQVLMMNQNAVKEYKELGAIQARQGNQDQAMANYKKYLDKNPSDEETALAVGNHEYGKKQYKSAAKYYEMVKKADFQSIQYLTRLGDCYYQSENYKKAAETFDKARKAKGVTSVVLKDILKPLAVSYEKDSQLPKAAEAYAAYVALPGVVDQEASYKRAFLIEKTDKDQAVRAYNANTKAFPRDARNFVRLGAIYGQKKETQAQAADNLGAAVKLVDNDAAVWLQLAQASGKLNRTDAELAAYKRYFQLKPQDLTVTRRMGEIQHEKKMYSEAITNLEIYLTTNDKDVKVLVMLADAYEGTNRQQRTTELLAKARSLNGNDPDVRERLYKMYKREGKKDLAEAEIKELVNLSKDNKHRLMLCGDLVQAGKLDEAARVANDIKKSDPTNFDGLMALASIQRLQKKYQDAIETYKLVFFANDKYAPALAGRAEAHFALAEYDRAETYYKRALSIDPKMASAELGLSRVYKALKNKDLQAQHLNRAKLLDPNNKAIQDELKLLK